MLSGSEFDDLDA